MVVLSRMWLGGQERSLSVAGKKHVLGMAKVLLWLLRGTDPALASYDWIIFRKNFLEYYGLA